MDGREGVCWLGIDLWLAIEGEHDPHSRSHQLDHILSASELDFSLKEILGLDSKLNILKSGPGLTG